MVNMCDAYFPVYGPAFRLLRRCDSHAGSANVPTRRTLHGSPALASINRKLERVYDERLRSAGMTSAKKTYSKGYM